MTLLTGFLGAGKTTLLNRILEEEHGERCAVIVNEFGDVPVDGRLVVGADDELVELANGCICCTVRGDLLDTLADLLRRRKRRLFKKTRFDRILVEASGLASPGPAASTLHVPELMGELRLDGIVTVTHAAEIVRQLAEHPEAAEQAAYADHLLLNHVDRADDEALREAEAVLRRCNPAASLERSERAQVSIASLFGRRMPRATELASQDVAQTHADPGHAHDDHAHTAHTSGVSALAFQSDDPLDMEHLKFWLGFVGERREQELLRAKGVVRCVGQRHGVVVQVVSRWLEVGPDPAHEPPERSQLVFIGRNLDEAELQRGWEACKAGG